MKKFKKKIQKKIVTQQGAYHALLYSKTRINNNHIFFLISGSAEVRWNFVHGLFENAIYGGRVDNTYDLNVLKSYLQQYFEPNVVTGGQVCSDLLLII